MLKTKTPNHRLLFVQGILENQTMYSVCALLACLLCLCAERGKEMSSIDVHSITQLLVNVPSSHGGACWIITTIIPTNKWIIREWRRYRGR